jgi:hypothetical protein
MLNTWRYQVIHLLSWLFISSNVRCILFKSNLFCINIILKQMVCFQVVLVLQFYHACIHSIQKSFHPTLILVRLIYTKLWGLIALKILKPLVNSCSSSSSTTLILSKYPFSTVLYPNFSYTVFPDFYFHCSYLQYAISVRLANVIPVEECRHVRTSKNDPHQWKYLCIEGIIWFEYICLKIKFIYSYLFIFVFLFLEPFDLTNTARSVYDPDAFDRIQRTFSKSYRILMESHSLDSLFKIESPAWSPILSEALV